MSNEAAVRRHLKEQFFRPWQAAFWPCWGLEVGDATVVAGQSPGRWPIACLKI